MANLTDILHSSIGEVQGARLAGVIGTDGLGVEMVYSPDDHGLDLELAELELAALAASATDASGRIGAGRVRELMIETDGLTCLATQITRGYYAVFGVGSIEQIGAARSAVQKLVQRIQKEL